MKIMHDIRSEYAAKPLDPENLSEKPTDQCAQWFNEIEKLNLLDSNAATLSTYDSATGRVRGRIILIKEITSDGFIFFTNYSSEKGKEIAGHSNAAITVYWPSLFRQIRCEGFITKINPDLSDKYFLSRPRESQVSAIVSKQSKVIPNRVELEKNFNTLLNESAPLKRPVDWGGYELKADYWEFWQGRNHRLHDRIRYVYKNDQWTKERLSP